MRNLWMVVAFLTVGWVSGANAATYASVTVSNGAYDDSINKFTANFNYSIDPDFSAVRDYTLTYSYDVSPFGMGMQSHALGAISIDGIIAAADTLFAPIASGFPIGTLSFGVPASVVLELAGESTTAAVSLAYEILLDGSSSDTSGFGSIILSELMIGLDGGTPVQLSTYVDSFTGASGSATLTAPIPLPMTLPLLAGGLGLLAAVARRGRATA